MTEDDVKMNETEPCMVCGEDTPTAELNLYTSCKDCYSKETGEGDIFF